VAGFTTGASVSKLIAVLGLDAGTRAVSARLEASSDAFCWLARPSAGFGAAPLAGAACRAPLAAVNTCFPVPGRASAARGSPG
jgi:hypothetical protein